MIKKISVLFLSLVILSLSQGASLAVEVSSAEFLNLVRENNPTLQASSNRVEAFSHTVKSTVAMQRPSAGVRGNTGWYSDSDRARQGSYTLSAAVSSIIDVSGIYPAREKELLLQYNVLALDHFSLVNNTLALAENLYWRSFIARENIALQKEILAQRREDLRITEEKFRQQLIPRLDVIRAQAKIEEADSLVVDAESTYQSALAEMASLAGGTAVTPASEALLMPTLSVKAGVEEAREQRNDVRSIEAALERGRVLKTLAAKGMSPVLEGSVGYTMLTDAPVAQQRQNEFLLSLNLSVPVYDGGETREDVAEKTKTIEALEESLRARRNSVAEEVVKAITQWERAAAIEASKRKQLARSNEELRITQLMYKEGMGAQIDLLNAQVDNQRVRTEHLTAIKEMYLALVSLKQAMSEYQPAPAR